MCASAVHDAVLRLIGLELARLHNAGIVHGDPTTSNMMITSVDSASGAGSSEGAVAPLGLHLVSVAVLMG